MATTSNFIQWPTHRRKAAQRKRSRKAITKGLISGKASRTISPVSAPMGIESAN